MESTVAKYANALVSISNEESKLSEYKQAVKEFDAVLSSNSELKKTLESYFISNEEKFALIDQLLADNKLTNWKNFLKLVTEKHVIFKFHDLAKELVFSLNEELGIYDGFVYSTVELDSNTKKNIEQAISKKLGVEVELTNIIDERLIGGVKVVVHDHVFDGSILHKLDEMKHKIIERRVQ